MNHLQDIHSAPFCTPGIPWTPVWKQENVIVKENRDLLKFLIWIAVLPWGELSKQTVQKLAGKETS